MVNLVTFSPIGGVRKGGPTISYRNSPEKDLHERVKDRGYAPNVYPMS